MDIHRNINNDYNSDINRRGDRNVNWNSRGNINNANLRLTPSRRLASSVAREQSCGWS